MPQMHLVSWNVNGIRAIIKKDFLKDIKAMSPDIVCLQETKAYEEQVEMEPLIAAGFEYQQWRGNPSRTTKYRGCLFV